VVFANVGVAKSRYEALASRLGSECPRVIAGSRVPLGRSKRPGSARKFEQIAALREEVYAALRDALLSPDREASFALAAKLRTLRWNTPTVRRRVNGYAKALEQRFAQPVPNPCLDMKAWAASGYRTLSAATRAFLHEYQPPRRLVITDGSTPTIRHMYTSWLEREAGRYDRVLLVKVRALKRRLASALKSLVIINRHLERILGFPVL
jgi:hypothetical protein